MYKFYVDNLIAFRGIIASLGCMILGLGLFIVDFLLGQGIVASKILSLSFLILGSIVALGHYFLSKQNGEKIYPLLIIVMFLNLFAFAVVK